MTNRARNTAADVPAADAPAVAADQVAPNVAQQPSEAQADAQAVSDTVRVEYRPKFSGRKVRIVDDTRTGAEWHYTGRDVYPVAEIDRALWEQHADAIKKDYNKRLQGAFAGTFRVLEDGE